MIDQRVAYGALAATAIGGLVVPILFPTATAVKTGCFTLSAAAAAILAVAHQSGTVQRRLTWLKTVRDSQHDLKIQQLASWQLRQQKRLDIEELVEVLMLLDNLTGPEQRYFLAEMGLSELLPIYQSQSQQPLHIPMQAVSAQPIPEERYEGSLQWGNSQQPPIAYSSAPLDLSVDRTFLEIDLGKVIAEMIVGGEVPWCVLIACAARTGKTTLLTTTIYWLHRLTEGNCTIKIWNGKEKINPETGQIEDQFLGLVNDKTRYMRVLEAKEAKICADAYHTATTEISKMRIHPDVEIMDEVNNIRAAITAYDKYANLKKATLETFDADSALRVTQGTSQKKFTIFTSHSSYVSNIGIDRSYQDSMYTIVLGKGASANNIYKALSTTGVNSLVMNKALCAKLKQQFEDWRNDPDSDKSKVVCLTNLIGQEYGLYFVKHLDLGGVSFEGLSDDPPPPPPASTPTADRSPHPAYNAAYQAHLDRTGGHSSTEPDTLPQSPIVRAANPDQLKAAIKFEQDQFIGSLHAWITTLGRMPTDTELTARVKELLQVDPSPSILTGIKSLLVQYGYKFD